MQAYTRGLNLHHSRSYQERAPAQYQERGPAQYQERGPAQYQERGPAQYQERGPAQYQERPPPQYQEGAPAQYQERGPAQYQERPPPQYQEGAPAQYQERAPAQYQERPPPQYQERSSPPYQGQFPPNYHSVRNDHPSTFQPQLIPQLQTIYQARYSNGRQEAANQWNACSGSADSSTFQQNSNGYNWVERTNQIHNHHQLAASQTQQRYSSDKSNAYRYHVQLAQRHDSSPQNYRNTGCNQAQMRCSPRSNHGSSVGNSRGFSSHTSNNDNSCSMNNQQQFQAPRNATYYHHHHHHQQQQQQPQQVVQRQYSNKKQRHHTQSSSQANHKTPINQAQSRTNDSFNSCKSTTPSRGQSNVSLPSNNLSPVDQNAPEFGSNACPGVSATQPQNNHNAGHQSQGTNEGTCNVNQTLQTTQTSEANLQTHTKTSCNLTSYADLAIQKLVYQNTGHQSQGTKRGTCNVNQTLQTTQTSEANLQTHTKTSCNLTSYADLAIQKLVYQNTGHQSQGTNRGTCNVNQTTQTNEANLQTHTKTSCKLTSYADLAIQKLVYQNTGHQSQGTNNATCNVNQTTQTTQTSEAKLQPPLYADSIIYRLLCQNDNTESGAPPNTNPEQLEVCASKRTNNHSEEPFSEPRAQCTVEPPSKRMKYAVIQRNCWNKLTVVSKDKNDFTHQTSNDENRRSQRNIQYSTDPADCLEAVFALQKAAQQSYKAIAIVPPISQQISNAAPTTDTSPKKAESPPLKIDCVWSLADESNEQKTSNDKLSESSSQVDNQSLENTTECSIAAPDACSASPVECQKDVQQSDCESSDPSFDLSNVPVIEYTLEKVMDLAETLNKTEVCPDNPESVSERILKLYWNGSIFNLLESFRSFGEIQSSTVAYAKDYGSVVFESVETENLKKLAHCEIIKNEMHLSSEEFRSSWLNLDGQPADIEKVLSEPLLDDAHVFLATAQTFPENAVDASASLGANAPSVNPHTSSPTNLFKEKAGNDPQEVTVENNGHSYVMLRKEREKEPFKKQEDINQNQHFNTEPSDISTLVERPSAKLADLGNAKEVFREDQEQTRDNVSDSASLNPGDSVSDGAKTSEASLSTSVDTWQVEDISDDEHPVSKEALNNSSETWQVEDISVDEHPVSKEALNNSSDTWQVEDISVDEHPVSKEALNNSLATWQVEDISDDENPVIKDALKNCSETWQIEDISDDENPVIQDALKNCSETWQIEDISDDENPGSESLSNSSDTSLVEDISNKDISGNEKVLFSSLSIGQVEDIGDNENEGNEDNTSDICVVEDISADENSSNGSLFMGITVLSKEDAKTFFQLFKEEPECNKSKPQSDMDCPDLVACLEPNHNKANACSRCGTEITKPSFTNGSKTDSDADLFCPDCWEQAPLLELEEEPYEADLTVSAAEPEKLDQNDSVPCLTLEVIESNLGLTKERTAYERQKRDCLVKSHLEENCSPPTLEKEDITLTVASNDEYIEYEGMAGQKGAFFVNSEQGNDCSPPSVKLKDKKTNVSLLEASIAEDKTEQKPELVENCSQLKIKELTVASTRECAAGQGQKTDGMMQSKQQQSEVSSPGQCIANERLQSPRRNSIGKSEMGQSCSSPALELKVTESNFDTVGKSELGPQCLKREVKEPAAASAEGCIADERLTGPNCDGMVKSGTKTVSEIQGSAERELTKLQPSKQKTEKSRVPKTQSLRKDIPKKTNKLKSGSTSTGADDSVLFAPDIVVKTHWPQKKKQPANKRHSGQSQDCSKGKKFKEQRQERLDNPDAAATQKGTEKVSPGSENKPEMHGMPSMNKEPKKLRFDLYGSKKEKQFYAIERRFSAPATLTVSDSVEYNDVLSAKQKVLNQWSSTFVHKTKTTRSPPRSPQEGSPQKKKPQKPQDLLKSNMSALKRQLTHRAKLLSSSDKERSHFRKPFFHQKLRKTLSSEVA